MLDTTANARLQTFLAKFDAALAAGDADAAVEMFAKDSYWRDLVAFTWNIRTMEGRDEVRDMLAHCLARVKPLNWRIAEGETATEAGGVLEILDLVRDRNRAGLRAHSGQGWPDLDPADNDDRAQGP